MSKLKTLVLTVTMLTLCINAYADNPSAEEILKKVAATYKSMKTYKIKGESYYSNKNNEIPFTILFKEPNMYLISWTLKRTPPHYFISWNDGTQPYRYQSGFNFF